MQGSINCRVVVGTTVSDAIQHKIEPVRSRESNDWIGLSDAATDDKKERNKDTRKKSTEVR